MTSSPLALHISIPNKSVIVRNNHFQRSIDEMINEKKSENEEEKDEIKIETQDENSPIQNSSSSTRNLTKKPKRRRRLFSATKTRRSSNRTKTNLNKIENENDESEKILKNNDDDNLDTKTINGDDKNVDVKRNNNHRQQKQQPNGVDKQQIKKCDNISKQKSSHRMTKRQPTTITTSNNVITNYFPVISRRLLAAKLKEEEYNQRIIECIVKQTDPFDYLAITEFQSKGKAIIAKEPIRKGSFICEYSGDLIDLDSAKKRELEYEQNQAGCYMYYFNWNSTIWCVDATKPTDRLGRLINHSRKAPNCKTKIFEYKQRPHLIFIALRDINQDEEILYDYGERDPMAIKSHPWLTAT
uniref:Histone-lysine N-methyltransferase set-1-like n=1 Tax=Dermatophagoides pteronyssinus TaxID=6956 RepID=A0A6P6Y225_DERPT|nr:histone-lysine N-methyltransferase set-1-like [Dermatophagoides pteronyssinus]